jgi:hypothetical protein
MDEQSRPEARTTEDEGSAVYALEELSSRMDAVLAELAAQRLDSAKAASERIELGRQLRCTQDGLLAVQGQIEGLVSTFSASNEPSFNSRAPTSGSWEVGPWRRRWASAREGKKGLGASLTLTGFVAIVAGILLHIGLRAHAVDSTVHLGYTIGLVGLFSLLIGLVLVF